MRVRPHFTLIVERASAHHYPPSHFTVGPTAPQAAVKALRRCVRDRSPDIASIDAPLSGTLPRGGVTDEASTTVVRKAVAVHPVGVSGFRILAKDLLYAASQTRPSALRSLLVEVPKVGVT